MKRDIVFVLFVAIVAAVFMSVGCASMNSENVRAFTGLVEQINARGAATVDDPALEFYFYHETGVGARLQGVHAQGSGYGAPPEDEVPE